MVVFLFGFLKVIIFEVGFFLVIFFGKIGYFFRVMVEDILRGII